MPEKIVEAVEGRLRSFSLLEQYPKEEPDLLNHVESQIREILGPEYYVITEEL